VIPPLRKEVPESFGLREQFQDSVGDALDTLPVDYSSTVSLQLPAGVEIQSGVRSAT
jgi:hypothetical protein